LLFVFISIAASLAQSGSGFRELQDGRVLCRECSADSAPSGSDSAAAAEWTRRLFDRVVDFMERQLGLPIPKGMRDVPVLAVDLSALNENRRNACSNSHDRLGHSACVRLSLLEVIARTARSPTVRGLTLSSRGEVRHYSMGRSLAPVELCVQETRAVSAVLVLCGLPRALTASILAHEAMHVWLKLSSHMPFDLRAQVEEGLCQVVSHKFLEEWRSFGGSFEDSTSCERLRAFYLHQIVSDPSPVYGDGFRAASKCEKALGLGVVLEHLALTKQLPTVD